MRRRQPPQGQIGGGIPWSPFRRGRSRSPVPAAAPPRHARGTLPVWHRSRSVRCRTGYRPCRRSRLRKSKAWLPKDVVTEIPALIRTNRHEVMHAVGARVTDLDVAAQPFPSPALSCAGMLAALAFPTMMRNPHHPRLRRRLDLGTTAAMPPCNRVIFAAGFRTLRDPHRVSDPGGAGSSGARCRPGGRPNAAARARDRGRYGQGQQ